MKKIILLLMFLSVLGCQSGSKKHLDTIVKDNRSVKNSVRRSDSINRKKNVTLKEQTLDMSSKLLGVWIVSTSQTGNASFVLEKGIMYYPETDSRHKYKVVGDSIIINYDDYIQHLSFKFKGNDTLLLKGDEENNIYYRVKK